MKLIKDRRCNYQVLYDLQKKSIAFYEEEFNKEKDKFIKKALLNVLCEKYEEMIDYIEFGAKGDIKEMMISLDKTREKLKDYENI